MPDTRYCPKCGEACGPEDRFCTSCRSELRPTTSRQSGGFRPGSTDPRDILASTATELGLPTGSLLADRYKIIKELGAGGMGRVYLAEDQKLGIPVAVKVLRDILKQDPGSVKRLVSEARASILLAHPNIVRLHNFEDGETAKFLVMEYVEGETLAHKIAREGKVSEEECRRIGAEVCKGLELAHQKRVIHRDMKPGNVLLGKDGSVKIADFGIARLCRDSMSRLTSQQDSGTLLYMAPEQLDGESGEPSDIYSFGVMLYEMLAGDPPFLSGEITAQIRYKAPKDVEGLSPAMRRIVMKCLEKKPENRFASAHELREELDGTAEQRRVLQAETGPRVDLLRSSGVRALSGGDFAQAIALWEQALALKPGDPDLIDSIKRAREQQSSAGTTGTTQPRMEKGQADTGSRETIDQQQHIEALKAKGSEAYNAGRFGEAIAAWQEALNLNPGDPGLNEMLSAARKQADLVIQEAERKKAEQATKQWADDVMTRVNALFQRGTYKEAENLLQQALQHLPDHTQLAEQLENVRRKLNPPDAPKKPPKSRKKLWYAVGITIAVFVVLGIIGQMGSSSTVAGTWQYTLTTPMNSWGGQIEINGSDESLQLSTEASYRALGTDGFPHSYSEQFTFVGSLNGNLLSATCTGGSSVVDGNRFAPPLPMRLDLTLSADRRTLQGQVTNSLGVGMIVARKQ